MSEELLINVTPRETRIGIVENGVMQEVMVERASRRGYVGNIYQGRVCRVLPGMQAAFLDIGLDRSAFLHVAEVNVPGHSDNEENQNISSLLHEGQEVFVQVIKDPLGSKGARLTTNLSIPSRFLVLLPGGDTVGVSQKIENPEERDRLKDIIDRHCGDMQGFGWVVRTAAEGADEEAIITDIRFLQRLWESIQERTRKADGISIVYEDLPIVLRSMRDLVASTVSRMQVDSNETYQKVLDFAENFFPELVPRIEFYSGKRPIFDLYCAEDEIQKALDRKVPLKSGGYLMIDQTEAMTTIDVNTGAYVGHRNLEETVFKTNLEAAQALARQLRLRNLGGIIIVDFIDMTNPDHRLQVLGALELALGWDSATTNVTEVSEFGLVEMTRKRTRESLEHVLCETCPTCSGRGSIKTAETVCYEIFREIIRAERQFNARQYRLLASQSVIDLLLDEESSSLAELDAFISKPINLQVEPLYTQEQFDVVPM